MVQFWRILKDKYMKINPIEDNLSKTNARALRKEIKDITAKKIEIDLDFCKNMFYSKVSYVEVGGEAIPFYEYCDANSWKEYVEQEVGITIGAARKYANVYSKYCVELESFSPKKHGIDIEKLHFLIRIVDDSNLDSLIETARTADLETLQMLLGPGRKTPIMSRTFRFGTKKEDKIVNRAMKTASKEFGNDLTDSQLFVAICTEYLEHAQN